MSTGWLLWALRLVVVHLTMKRNRKLQPAFLFVSATVLLLLSGVVYKDKTCDIQLQDTYFVTGYFGLAIILLKILHYPVFCPDL